jgi:hypothetical protein
MLKAAVGVAVLAGGLLPVGTAVAAPTTATAACTMTVGSVTAGGDIGYSSITAGSPITARQGTGVHLFTPGITKLSTAWVHRPNGSGGDLASGEVLLNSTLYNAWYGTKDGKPVSGMSNSEYGHNYTGYLYSERTSTVSKDPEQKTYRLRGDGVLYRFDHHWEADFPYDDVTRYAGFAAVKTMALISETASYDMFLANARGGALYTIKIPANRAQQPVVTKLRTSTWQGFESLVAERCGTQSTLLTGIDRDTGAAYLYAVGHANGAATVIQGLGKVPGTYQDPVYYRRTEDTVPPLYGG